jgi:hypothetical protein
VSKICLVCISAKDEADQATSARDVGSSRKISLLRMGLFGFGCFALGLASACLVLSSASHDDSLQKPAHHVPAVAFVPLRANPADAPTFETPSTFRPTSSRTSVVTNARKKKKDDPLEVIWHPLEAYFVLRGLLISS